MNLIGPFVIICSAIGLIRWLLSNVYSAFAVLKLDHKNQGQKRESQTEPALFSVTRCEALEVNVCSAEFSLCILISGT